jgi:hypothetical protein
MSLVHKILSVKKVGGAALHPAPCSLDSGGNVVQHLEQTGNWDWEIAASSVFFERHPGGSSRRCFMTVRLQPQMKKYRCLWCVSTINHNI